MQCGDIKVFQTDSQIKITVWTPKACLPILWHFLSVHRYDSHLISLLFNESINSTWMLDAIAVFVLLGPPQGWRSFHKWVNIKSYQQMRHYSLRAPTPNECGTVYNHLQHIQIQESLYWCMVLTCLKERQITSRGDPWRSKRKRGPCKWEELLQLSSDGDHGK